MGDVEDTQAEERGGEEEREREEKYFGVSLVRNGLTKTSVGALVGCVCVCVRERECA